MRLPASQARAVARAAKTVVRVPVDPRLTARPLRPATRHGGTPWLPQIGETYPVHGGRYMLHEGRWKWTTTDSCHVLIRERHMAELGHLDEAAAQAEGHSSAEEFEIAWVDHHDHAWIEKQVRVLEEAGDSGAEDTRDWWALNRYLNRWARQQVWVLKVEAIHDLPRLLPNEHGTVRVHDTADERPRKGDEGYTHTASAAMDDLDAIDVGRLHTRWSQAAQARHRKAVAAAASDEEKRRKARALARRVRQLAISGAPCVAKIESLVHEAECSDEAA